MKKIPIFANNCFWHRCPHCNPNTPKSNLEFWQNKFDKNVERDKKKLKLLKEEGWEALVIWECKIKAETPECVQRIREILM